MKKFFWDEGHTILFYSNPIRSLYPVCTQKLAILVIIFFLKVQKIPILIFQNFNIQGINTKNAPYDLFVISIPMLGQMTTC
jgi:hypothetical protein